MKSLKEIENMSIEELESVSMDCRIGVPEDFAERTGGFLGVMREIGILTDNRPGRSGRIVKFIGIAASVALLVGLSFGTARWLNEPEDTFDDPYLAYAELEKAFAKISAGMQKGVALADKSEEIIGRTNSVFSE